MRPQIINSMAAPILKAARGILRDFGEVEHLQASSKKPEFVARAEQRTEEILHGALHEAYPQYNFLMEESGFIDYGGQDAPVWIIDPLDGTNNFSRGLPHFSISVALKEGPHLTAGIIYDPLRNELFWACRGKGAFLDRSRLRVSNCLHITKSILACGSPAFKQGKKAMEAIMGIASSVSGIRVGGATSLDLAYVAAGRYDGAWEHASRPWDIAAGLLLVKEAGGMVSDHKGQQTSLKSGDVIAAGEQVHQFLLKSLLS